MFSQRALLDNPPNRWHKYVSVRLRNPKKNPTGALTFSLALWIGLLPFFSAVHMAMVPHVYSTEHRHFHEVVISGQGDPVEDTSSATASIMARSSASLLTSIEECPLCDLALRQGAIFSQCIFPKLFDRLIQNVFSLRSIHTAWPVLYRAPKHSPPFQTA